MQKVTIHVAKTNLSKLIEAAMAGEEVVIAKGNKPVVKLVAIPENKFKIGIDPFDRMLAATALYYGLPLISADVVFDGKVSRVW